MLTSEVLDEACDLIERDGWWSESNRSSSGQCASNAILAVVGDATAALPTQHALSDYLGGSSVCDIFDWNDHPARTKHEVVATMRAAAVVEAAKETASTPALVTA